MPCKGCVRWLRGLGRHESQHCQAAENRFRLPLWSRCDRVHECTELIIHCWTSAEDNDSLSTSEGGQDDPKFKYAILRNAFLTADQLTYLFIIVFHIWSRRECVGFRPTSILGLRYWPSVVVVRRA